MSTGNITEQSVAKILAEAFGGTYTTAKEGETQRRQQTIEEYAQENRNLMLLGSEFSAGIDSMTRTTRARVDSATTPSINEQLVQLQEHVGKREKARGLGSAPAKLPRGTPSIPATPELAFLDTIQRLLLSLREDAHFKTEEPINA